MPGWPAPLNPVLDGRIVRLEPLDEQHRAPLREAAADPGTWTWICPYPAADAATWDAWFDAALALAAAGEEAPFATVDIRTGRPIGSTRFLSLRPEDRGLEIGWTWLEPAARRTGANPEAKLLQLTHAFETLGAIRVELKTHASNARSRGAMTKLGAVFEGVHRKHRLVPGVGDGIRDTAWFSIVDDEWPAVKAALEARVRAAQDPRRAPGG